MNILFDGNYLIHKCFSVWSMYHTDRAATPEENNRRLKEALRSKEQQQVFLRKVIIDACAAINKFENVEKVAFTIDSSSWRYKYHPDYKYALTRVRGDYYEDFLNLIRITENFLRKKGFIVSRVDGAEGDDLMYMWSEYFTEVLRQDLVIITGDSDIRQLITDRVSLFCNNSKTLKMFCTAKRLKEWRERLDPEIAVEAVRAVDVLLYKVIMGDKSDNIPKLVKGFGDVAFKKFIMTIDRVPVDMTFTDMAVWITEHFCNFTNNPNRDEIYGKVLFNLGMTWLNVAVYAHHDTLFTLLNMMTDDINVNKFSYNYNKPFTLENVYGAMIK